MDKKTIDVINFLFIWNDLLLEPPIDGSIPELYFLFISSNKNRGKDKVSWIQFIKYLKAIDDVSFQCFQCRPANALSQTYEDPFKCSANITYINRLALSILFNSLRDKVLPSDNKTDLTGESVPISDKENQETSLATKDKDEKLRILNALIDDKTTLKSLTPLDGKDIYTTTEPSRRLVQLTYLLKNNIASYDLSKEKARLSTPIVPFVECCSDIQHSQRLISFTDYDSKTSYGRLNRIKFQKELAINSQKSQDLINLSKCLMKKIHFVPIIHSQTDIKLGDCSYLDTCHKMNVCRYVHYCQLMPVNLQENNDSSKRSGGNGISSGGSINSSSSNSSIANNKGNSSSNNGYTNDLELIKHNNEINEVIRISDYTKGDPISFTLQHELPPQWINCDVRKINFEVLGKFAAIIADPAWSIHMTLPYSTCDDNELINLRMDLLQDEGIFLLWVTGRSIETGRNFLTKWGYEIVNQITWIKTNQLVRTIATGRTGHWLNHSKEHLIVGLKGDPKWLNRGLDPQLLISSTRETSRKPDEIYGIVERMVGKRSRKLEIFGRDHNIRNGWLTIGNQLDGINLYEKDLATRLDDLFQKTTT